MPEQRPEYHLYDDFSLTPAYAMGYAFHALERVDAGTPVHGPRGAVALLTELFATLTTLRLDASLSAAEPLRLEQEALSRSPRSARMGSTAAAHVVAVLPVLEAAVQAELEVRGMRARPRFASGIQSYSLRTLVGETAFELCPDQLRPELTDACRALDARLHTAAVFHLCRLRDGLTARSPRATGSMTEDPREDPALRCNKTDAVRLLEEILLTLESFAEGA